MTHSAALLQLAVAEAPHPAAQAEVRAFAGELFHGADFDLEELSAVFANAGVERRTFALPLPAYAERTGPAQRNRTFLDVAGGLLTDVAARALPPDLRRSVTHVVTVSNTGIATPSLECDVIERLGLPAGTRRVPVFGLGCAGGVAGLALASDLVRGDPEALVLVLCVELTSLTFLREDQSRRNFVACALFGDGAAAALVGGSAHEGARVRLGRSRTRLFPDSRDMMGWRVRDVGWEVVFSQRIPAVVHRHAAELVQGFDPREELRHHALHPGGRKVLDAYRAALELSDDDLAPSEAVLARHGNMSAVTVLFVLDELLRDDRRGSGAGVATAFGPGFSAEVLAFELSDPTP